MSQLSPKMLLAWCGRITESPQMKILPALLVTLCALFWTHGSAAMAAEPDKPNIIFILSDDQGIDGVGCYGAERFKGKTPNIDALAQTGTRFTQCYANPLCGPSRCTLMT